MLKLNRRNLGPDPQKAARLQAMLEQISDQKNVSSYLGVCHMNFTIWDNETKSHLI